MDHSRDPCPWVALSDFGGAFAMGVRPANTPPPKTPSTKEAPPSRAYFYLYFLAQTTALMLHQGIGGAVWHGVKGFRNSPYGERRIGALTAIKARAPVLGGNFGVWGGLFSTFDCAVKGIRKKEDPYNASECTCHEWTRKPFERRRRKMKEVDLRREWGR